MNNKLAYILIPILIAVIMPFTAFKHTTANASDELENKTLYSIVSNGTFYTDVNATYTNNLGNYYFNYEIIGNLQPCNFVKGTMNGAGLTLEYYDYRNLAVERILEERTTEPFYERYHNLPLVSQYSFWGTTLNRFQTKLEFIESDMVTLEFNNVLIPSLPSGLNDNINNVLNRMRFNFNGLRGNVIDTYCTMEYYNQDGEFNDKYSLISYAKTLSGVTNKPFTDVFERFYLNQVPITYEYGNQLYYVIDKITLRFYLNTSKLDVNVATYKTTDGFLTYDNSTTIITDYLNDKGYANGYDIGYYDGLNDNENVKPFALITNAIEDFLHIQIFPNFYVYTLLLIALGFTLFGLLVKYALGG